jgi:hypothetical protein
MVIGANTSLAKQPCAFSQSIAVPSLPPSIQSSVQKAVSNGAFFLHHNSVLLPPPAGLFSNWSAPPASVHRMGQIICAQPYPTCPFPVFRNSNQHVSAGCSSGVDPQGPSSSAQRRVREGVDSDGSDDNQSQCSTASYDGSQRSKSNVKRPKILHCSVEGSHSVTTVGGFSNSNGVGDENRDGQDIKKRTWKVLLTPEQACEVFCIYRIRCLFGAPTRRRF